MPILAMIDGSTSTYSLGILGKTMEIRVKQCPEFNILTGSKPGFHDTKQAIAFQILITFAFNMTTTDSDVSNSR